MTTAESGLGRRLGNGLVRLVTHLMLLAVVVGLLVAFYPQKAELQSRPAGDAILNRPVTTSRGTTLFASASTGSDVPVEITNGDIQVTVVPTSALALATSGDLFKSPQPETIIPKRPRKELIVYTVQAGDNLSTLAERYEVDVDTLIWANEKLEEDPDYLVIGQTLVIPPVVGVLYTVKDGDTLDAIVKKFKGDLRAARELEYNKPALAAAIVVSGTQIMIPGGEKPYLPRLVYIGGYAVMVNAPRGGGRFMWPTNGYISTYWGPDHRGIDIAAPQGTPIYASDAGVVVASGWMGGYGNALIIDHGNGFQTLYAHLLAYYPQTGQNVRRGQALGKMGSTGNSTGPHLHFEILYGGGTVNPLRYLPQ